MNRQFALVFLFGLFFLNANLMAQNRIPDWKVDSLLQILDRPSANYEFNFNFSFSELDNEETPTPDSLATMSEEELQKRLTGKPADAKVYAQLVYRGLAQNDNNKTLIALQKGAEKYEEYINSHPKDSLAVQELAMMMISTQNYDFAMNTLDYGIQKFPNLADIHATRFQTLFYNLGKSEIASNYMDSLLQVFPDDATIAYLGFLKNYTLNMAQQDGQKILVDEVMKPVSGYFQRDPDATGRRFLYNFCKAYLYMNIKIITANQKKIESTNAVLANPKDLLSKEQIADLNSTVSFLQEAEKNKSLSTSLTSKILAMCNVLLGNGDKAEQNLIRYRDLSVEDSEISAAEEALTLLRIIQVQQSKKESIKIVEEKYKRSPSPKDLVVLSLLCMQDEQMKKAISFANDVTEKYPEFGPGWEMKAYLELKEKNFSGVSLTLAQGEGTSSDPVYYFLLKLIHQAGSEGAEKANKSLQALLDAQPENEKGLAFRKLLQE